MGKDEIILSISCIISQVLVNAMRIFQIDISLQVIEPKRNKMGK
jgi:hypothetical protein